MGKKTDIRVLSKRTIVKEGDFIRYTYKNLDVILLCEKISKNNSHYLGKIVISNNTGLWAAGAILSAMYIDLNKAGWDTAEILEDYDDS